MGSDDPVRCLEVSMIWDGTETCVVVRNRRSQTLWNISLALKQIRNYRGEDSCSWTVVQYGKVSLGSLQQAKILLEWEGPPIGLGIGYELEPDNPRSRDYELPEDFRRDWPNLGPNERSWKFPPWDPGAEIEGNVRAGGLSLEIIQKNRHEMILVLGQDTGEGLERLKTIAGFVRNAGYYPVLLKDVPEREFSTASIVEKLTTISSLCEFVILEDSVASGHLLELSLLARNRRLGAILRVKGQGSTWMTSDYEMDFPHLKGFAYDLDRLEHAVVAAIDWAEERIKKRALQMRSTYPWRRGA
jgi:hypothetical protein